MINFNILENLVCNCTPWKRRAKQPRAGRRGKMGGSGRTGSHVDSSDSSSGSADSADTTDTNLRRVYSNAKKHNIHVLPVEATFQMDNLYPTSNKVETWNTFVVGNDKTYIMVNINDNHLNIQNPHALHNHTAENILSLELREFFDPVWDATLQGNRMEFFISWNDKLFITNTYPFINDHSQVVGAIMFMRNFDPANYSAGPKRAGLLQRWNKQHENDAGVRVTQR